jgi:hypothetical protein
MGKYYVGCGLAVNQRSIKIEDDGVNHTAQHSPTLAASQLKILFKF